MTKVLPRRCRVWAASSLVRTTLLLLAVKTGWEKCSGRLLWGGAEAGLYLCCQRGKVWCWKGTARMEMRGLSCGWKGGLRLREEGLSRGRLKKNQDQGALFGLFLAERRTNERRGGCLGFSGFGWRRNRPLGWEFFNGEGEIGCGWLREKKKILSEGLAATFRWGRRVKFKIFRVFLFFVLPPTNCKIAPPVLSFGPIFIGKMLLGTQNWSLNFFFCKFWFFLFFSCIFENEQYQRWLKEKNQGF